VSETLSVDAYVDTPTHVLDAANGVRYAYHSTGPADAPPLVMLQHFRGNLDNWDPALGFSLGSFVAQEIALIRPAIVRHLVLASSAPQGASRMHGWAPEVIDAVGKPETSAAEYLSRQR
jgi:pimeloyl-ACP methyl ester carboxylesterase